MGRFIGAVIAEWLTDDNGDDREMKIRSPFAYHADNGETYTVPIDTIVDGASIPGIFWNLKLIGPPFVGDYRRSSVIHDWLCAKKVTKTSKEAHALFAEMIKVEGLGFWKRKLMSFAVKNFGPKWE